MLLKIDNANQKLMTLFSARPQLCVVFSVQPSVTRTSSYSWQCSQAIECLISDLLLNALGVPAAGFEKRFAFIPKRW